MKPWTFVFATDIHVGSPRSFRFEPAWNENWQTAREQIVAIGPELLLLGGDLTRDGNLHRYELEAVKTDLDALPFPYHVVPGNMDTGNKHTDVQGADDTRDDVSLNLTSRHLDSFSSVVGPAWWSFVHKEVRLSGFCDMVAGSGLPEEEALWEWLDAQRALPRARHHVWIMHSPLFVDDPRESNFNITDRSQYGSWYFNIDEPHRSRLMDVFKATGATLVACGHVHCRKAHFAERIRFDIAPSTAFHQWKDHWNDGDPTRGFLRYDASEHGIECTFVPLERLSTAKGYGPGGHPLPHQRDYSIAWET